MSQRGITENMLKTVKQFGIKQGERIILNKKAIQKALKELEALNQSLQSLHVKGGAVLVEDRNTQITCFDLDSYKRGQK
jgi:excinuclease UvrABC helicase subunit UvrB